MDFKKFFRKSKVVDSTGKPLKVYHGTEADFSAFLPRSKDRPDIWFSNQRSYAEEFGGNSRIVSAYLRIENPAPERMSFGEAIRGGYDGVIRKEIGDRASYVVFSSEQIWMVGNVPVGK